MLDGIGMSKLCSRRKYCKLTICGRIFWFLLILSLATFIPLMLFLPETCRHVVGDGSIPPPWTCSNISDSIRFQNRLTKGLPINQEKQAELRQKYCLGIPNPMATVRILADPESALLLASLSLGKSSYSTLAGTCFR